MQFQIKSNEFSSWTTYPYQYKFMSFDFDLNMDIQHTDRTSYDVLNMMGDVGGVLGFLFTVFSFMASPFADLRIKAILTNRLFHMSPDNRE